MKYLIMSLALLAACGDEVIERQVIGVPGPQGAKGDAGDQGFSVAIEQAPSGNRLVDDGDGGAVIVPLCANGGVTIVTSRDKNNNGLVDGYDDYIRSSTVCNGSNGADGANGQDGADAPPSAFTPVRAIAACGALSSNYKEVLLLLADGSLLASFSQTSSGQNTRLTLLPDGSYTNTDESGCHFTVSTSGSTRSISWSGGGESWQLGN